jgi:hypothetical protein
VVVPAIFPPVSSSATNILCNKLDFIFYKMLNASKNPLSISLAFISRMITKYCNELPMWILIYLSWRLLISHNTLISTTLYN